jgi:hypothetical protein
MLKTQDHRVRVAAVRREEMRNCLLYSGLSLAFDKSIHDIDVEEVIAHAQVSRGTFYNYYTSVSVLFEDLAQQLEQELASVLKASVPETTSATKVNKAQHLVLTSKLIMRLLVDIPALGKLFIQLPWTNQNKKSEAFEIILHDIEQCIKEGLLEKLPISIGFNLLMGSMIGGIHTMLLKPQTKGYEDKVIRQALIGLGMQAKSADKLITTALVAKVTLPTTGILGKIAMSQVIAKSE